MRILIDGYNLTNASVGYRWDSGLEVAVFARNLLDADYIQNVTIQAGNSGGDGCGNLQPEETNGRDGQRGKADAGNRFNTHRGADRRE